VFDRINSHIHIGVPAPALRAALAQIDSKGRQFLVEEVDFGQPIGETICVPTGPEDQIVYAKRPRRFGFSRFVKNRQPEPCSTLVVILKADDLGGYVLITAFVGKRPEPEPWDCRAFLQQSDPAEAVEKSRKFWNRHALVWGVEKVMTETITTECPW